MTTTRSRPAPQRLSPRHRIKLAFFVAGFLALVLSVTLWFTGSKEQGVFVGLWVPAIHSLGALVLVGEKFPPER